MRLNELHPRFGVEIIDANLLRMDAVTVESIRKAIARYGFVLFRRQSLEDADLAEVSKCIGDGRLEESARSISHSPHCKLVSNLTNLLADDGSPLGFGGNDTDYWHSDQEFRLHPATLASLYCLIPPASGGDTSFACTVASEIGISETLLEVLRPLTSTRVPAATHDNADHIEVIHPAVLVSPVDGREFIYISENTLRFPGLSQEAGERLKSSALACILSPDNIYRHSWRAGDFIVYDNTQLLHRREAFSGPRWLKGTKIFAPSDWFAVPDGEVAEGIPVTNSATG